MTNINFLLVGVGGQGTLLASNILAQTGVKAGSEVKKAEVHGMSQRGGSVSSHVRWGDEVHSPLIGRGLVDYLVAFEKLEALRYVSMLRPGGTAIVGEMRIPPLSVSSGDDEYPDDEGVQSIMEQVTDNFYFIPSIRLAEEAGNVRTHNILVLGALSNSIDQVSPEIWLEVIAEWVPKKFIEVNRRAFMVGRETGLTRG